MACAWAINTLVLPKAGVATIGAAPASVASVEEAPKSGRGELIEPRSNCQPGDIIIMGNAHIGICMAAGGIQVLSNSSSKATFSWESSIEKYDTYYQVSCKAYRVTQ